MGELFAHNSKRISKQMQSYLGLKISMCELFTKRFLSMCRELSVHVFIEDIGVGNGHVEKKIEEGHQFRQ